MIDKLTPETAKKAWDDHKNQGRAAAALGVSRSTFCRFVAKHKIRPAAHYQGPKFNPGRPVGSVSKVAAKAGQNAARKKSARAAAYARIVAENKARGLS